MRTYIRAHTSPCKFTSNSVLAVLSFPSFPFLSILSIRFLPFLFLSLGMMWAGCANPLGCCIGCTFCPCCACHLRHLALQGDMSKYKCCQGYICWNCRFSSGQKTLKRFALWASQLTVFFSDLEYAGVKCCPTDSCPDLCLCCEVGCSLFPFFEKQGGPT